MIMIHGDDKGLVLPPKVAPVQVAIIPIYKKGYDTTLVDMYVDEIYKSLKHNTIRSVVDTQTNHNPGYRFNEWEMKGTPFQIRIGPKEVENSTIYIVRRDGTRFERPFLDVGNNFKQEIEIYHSFMLQQAREKLDNHTKQVTKWADFITELDMGNILLVPWCENTSCEDYVKHQSVVDSEKDGSAKSLCVPFSQPEEKPEGYKCINPECTEKGKVWCLFGRSY
jgi:prolyl-tRNA synthetase